MRGWVALCSWFLRSGDCPLNHHSNRMSSVEPSASSALFGATPRAEAVAPIAPMRTTALPLTMKSLVYGTERLVWKTSNQSLPRTGRPGHVLVRVVAASLNPVNAKLVVGDKLPASWTTLHRWIRVYGLQNQIPGFDFAGICVESVPAASHDDDDEPLHEGDAVYGLVPPLVGSLAEYISVPLHQVCRMPRNVSFIQAAALPLVGLTALQALSPHIHSESSVLIVGASGGTGHVALQVATCLGASSVTAICSTRHVELCREWGATHVVDYTQTSSSATGTHITEPTPLSSATLYNTLLHLPSSPFDVVLDCVSSADPRDQVVNYPQLLQSTFSTTSILTNAYVYRRLGGPTWDWVRAGLERFVGPQSWQWPNRHDRLFWIRMPHTRRELQQLRDWVEAGQLQPHIAWTVPWAPDAVQDALDAILSRRVTGKLVVSIWDPDTEKASSGAHLNAGVDEAKSKSE